jgi:hypothetical protein
MTSNILRRFVISREFFDPTNSAHIESAAKFLETGQWGQVQFFVEQPYTNVQDTVLRKLSAHAVQMITKAAN